MRGRLALLVAATTSVVLLAFLLPLSVLISRAATNNAVTDATRESQSLASTVTAGTPAEIRRAIDVVRRKGYTAAVRLPGGSLGDAAADRAGSGKTSTGTITRLPSGEVLIRQPVFRDDGQAVVSMLVPRHLLRAGVTRARAVLGLLGLVLVLLSLVVADRLARSITSPITELAHAAERLGRGEIETRVNPDGPDEVREVGAALNRLAARIEELLAREREVVADLSHRLRTPITALRLDADGLRDEEERGRLGADVDDLTRHVDALIREARAPVRGGVEARCDARAVVDDRVAFWRALAEDQGREVDLALPATGVDVRASAADLEAALDALLGNVIAHTPETTGFSVSLEGSLDGGGVLVVADEGPGFTDGAAALGRGESLAGSTGLGLDIARRTAVASGGDIRLGRSANGGGACITMRLGPPAS
jgi:signal transduction histidine kinase